MLECRLAPFEPGRPLTAESAPSPVWASLPSHPLAENRPAGITTEAPDRPGASFKAALEAACDGLRLRVLFFLPPAANPSSFIVGVLLDPFGDLASYLEITHSGTGETGGSIGRVLRNVLRRDPRWRCESLESALRPGACGETTVELAIPFSSLGPVAAHPGWRANFYLRPAPDAPERLWSPTGHRRIDFPERFGHLRMETGKKI